MASTHNKECGIREKKKFFGYSPSKVDSALEAIRGGMKVAKASRNFNVPRTTLRNKLAGRSPLTSGHVGPQAVLGADIEHSLVVWIKDCARAGFPINKENLLESVRKIVTEGNIINPFVNDRPGRSWFDAFMRRHPDLSRKHAEYINRARALITEEKIRGWFAEVVELLGPEGCKVLEDPERVWNCDETSFFLAPKGGLILAPKGEHVYETSKNSDKENITTLFTVNALGELAPPLTLYKYKRMNQEVAQNAPSGWSIGKTDKGWMTSEAFYEYIGNVFLPYLKTKNITFPVILFLDGHKSHLTLHLSKLCRDNGIIVVSLVPNTTHMLQPLDVAVFYPLKQGWIKYIRRWRVDHDGEEITKFNLPTALKNIIINDNKLTDNVKAGFKACGIYPFGADFVNYKRIISTTKQTNKDEANQMRLVESNYLEYIEGKIEPKILEDFRETYNTGLDWEGCPEASMLYKVWLACKDDYNTMPSDKALSKASNHLTQAGHVIQAYPNATVAATVTPDVLIIESPSSTPQNAEFPDTPASTSKVVAINVVQSPTQAMDLVRNCVMWPEKKTTTLKRKREYVPSVLTSDKWKEIMTAKENEKDAKEKEKQNRTEERKRKAIQTKKTVLETTSDSSEELIDSDTSDGEDWIPQPRPSAFEELQRPPEERDYVLVEFKDTKRPLYYVGRIIGPKDESNELQISYLRKYKTGNQFIMPQVPDLASVAVTDIKIILPPPLFTGATKRQNSFYIFEINMSAFNVR